MVDRRLSAVYVIEDPGHGCKVGFAEHLQARFTAIQTANPRELRLAFKIWFAGSVISRRVEARVMDILKDQGKHLRGEWFSASAEEMIGVIRAVVAETGAQSWESTGAAVKSLSAGLMSDGPRIRTTNYG